MKFIKLFLVGLVFGFVLTKAEVISWYRIQEMFRFQAFHMYGVIGSAVGLGIILFQAIKHFGIKTIDGEAIKLPTKSPGFISYLLGGTIFGLGWAITGACPGPLYILVGNGYLVFLVVIAAAMLGTFSYGVVKRYLPH